MRIKQYQFGHVNIEIRMPDDTPVPPNMQLFETIAEEVDKVYELEFLQELDKVVREFRENNENLKEIERKNMQILVGKDKECRIIRFEGAESPYGVHIEEAGKHIHVWISRDVYEMLHFDTIFVSLLGLEKLMIRRNSLILHCAYMLRDGKGVLFSAPSGTGKSTQADLWGKYRGTRTINGDHALLLKEENGWYAYGWPICGSSEICHNETYPIDSIVMLYQSNENQIQKLKPFDAVKKVMPQIMMNMWNAKFQMQAMDQIQELVMEVPFYDFGCNISEGAVTCLEKILNAKA